MDVPCAAWEFAPPPSWGTPPRSTFGLYGFSFWVYEATVSCIVCRIPSLRPCFLARRSSLFIGDRPIPPNSTFHHYNTLDDVFLQPLTSQNAEPRGNQAFYPITHWNYSIKIIETCIIPFAVNSSCKEFLYNWILKKILSDCELKTKTGQFHFACPHFFICTHRTSFLFSQQLCYGAPVRWRFWYFWQRLDTPPC